MCWLWVWEKEVKREKGPLKLKCSPLNSEGLLCVLDSHRFQWLAANDGDPLSKGSSSL